MIHGKENESIDQFLINWYFSFNNTFNPKEHSWEPSPYHSRIEERGDQVREENWKKEKSELQENHPLRGDSRSILPSSFDTSKVDTNEE